MYEWDFNVFQLAERSSGRPLYVVTLALLDAEGLLVRDQSAPDICGAVQGTHCCCKSGCQVARAAADGGIGSGLVHGAGRGAGAHTCARARPTARPQDAWKLDRQVVVRYLNSIEKLYHANPYHNNIHAADVTQTAAVIMRALSQQLPGGLSPLERLSIILAAAVHDLAHPGVNNDFLIKTRDKQALVYNDRRCV